MDFDDLPRSVTEVARVLRVNSAFCICIVHPVFDAGSFEGVGPQARYRFCAQYFGTQAFDEAVTKRGVTMRFQGWSHSLEEYFSVLFEAGFVVDGFAEPTPHGSSEEYAHWARYPMFLHLRAIKVRDLGRVGKFNPSRRLPVASPTASRRSLHT